MKLILTADGERVGESIKFYKTDKLGELIITHMVNDKIVRITHIYTVVDIYCIQNSVFIKDNNSEHTRLNVIDIEYVFDKLVTKLYNI